ncbi:hypothetical protein AAMO2058_001342100 [Amorphochlora amoebiformis]
MRLGTVISVIFALTALKGGTQRYTTGATSPDTCMDDGTCRWEGEEVGERAKGGGREGWGGMSDDEVLGAIDVDGDGEVSLEELENALRIASLTASVPDPPQTNPKPFVLGKSIIYNAQGRPLTPKPPPKQYPSAQKTKNKRTSQRGGRERGGRAGWGGGVEKQTRESAGFIPPRGKCGDIQEGWWDGEWLEVVGDGGMSVSECCQRCILKPDCEFYNKQLSQPYECHLMRRKGYFHAEANHRTAEIVQIPIIHMTTTLPAKTSLRSETDAINSDKAAINSDTAAINSESDDINSVLDAINSRSEAMNSEEYRGGILENSGSFEEYSGGIGKGEGDIEEGETGEMKGVEALMDEIFNGKLVSNTGLGPQWKAKIRYLALKTLDQSISIVKKPLKAGAPGIYTLKAVNRNETKPYLGKVHLKPNGYAYYLPDERLLYGRGKGQWSCSDDGFVVIYLKVFQYRLPDILPEHTLDDFIFTGAFITENSVLGLSGLLFTPQGDPVGDGSADKEDEMHKLPWSSFFAVTPGARFEVLKDAAIFSTLPKFYFPPRPRIDLEKYKISRGGVKGVFYIPNWISISEASQIRQQLHKTPEHTWGSMRGSRRSIEWGTYTEDSPEHKGISYTDMPPWIKAISRQMEKQGVFSDIAPINTARLNYYTPGQGIPPHADGDIYVPKVAMISLGSPAVFSFYRVDGKRHGKSEAEMHQILTGAAARGSTETEKLLGVPRLSLVLQPRSLVIFEGEAAKKYAHGVAARKTELLDKNILGMLGNLKQAKAKLGDSIERTARTTITLRHILHT